MPADLLGGSDVLVGFLAALGAAFCFGYAFGHHYAGRSSQPHSPQPSPETNARFVIPELPKRAPERAYIFRLRRRRS
jgi:hypothetical protein